MVQNRMFAKKKLEVKSLNFEGIAKIFAGDNFSPIRECEKKLLFKRNFRVTFSKPGDCNSGFSLVLKDS